jgi:hypothetical protein
VRTRILHGIALFVLRRRHGIIVLVPVKVVDVQARQTPGGSYVSNFACLCAQRTSPWSPPFPEHAALAFHPPHFNPTRVQVAFDGVPASLRPSGGMPAVECRMPPARNACGNALAFSPVRVVRRGARPRTLQGRTRSGWACLAVGQLRCRCGMLCIAVVLVGAACASLVMVCIGSSLIGVLQCRPAIKKP